MQSTLSTKVLTNNATEARESRSVVRLGKRRHDDAAAIAGSVYEVVVTDVHTDVADSTEEENQITWPQL